MAERPITSSRLSNRQDVRINSRLFKLEGQGRAGQGRAGQGRAAQRRAGQGIAGQGRAGRGGAGRGGQGGQGRAGQGEGQGRAGQAAWKEGPLQSVHSLHLSGPYVTYTLYLVHPTYRLHGSSFSMFSRNVRLPDLLIDVLKSGRS